MNLAKATKLIDDRSALIQPDAEGKSGKRRKSGFGEEEEGYMFVEEGFRVRFANGECIDFYADNAEDKIAWMKVLSEVIGKDTSQAGKAWTDIVLSRERSVRKATEAKQPSARAEAAVKERMMPLETKADGIPLAPPPAPRPAQNGSKSSPNSPTKHSRDHSKYSSREMPMEVATHEPKRESAQPMFENFSRHPGQRMQDKAQDRRKQVRSMIF